MWKSALFIARHDLGNMLRQKETLFWVFPMPILFFFFIGTVTGGFGTGSDDAEPDTLALFGPTEGDVLVDALVRRLEAENYAVVRSEDEADLALYSRRLTVGAPEGEHESFTAGVLAGNQAVLTLRPDGDGLRPDYDRVRVARAVYGVLADLVVFAEDGREVTPEAFGDLAAMPRALTLESRPAGERQHIPTGYEQTIPGTMTMFCMLVLLTGGAVLLVIEREQGLLRRLASTPIPRRSIVLGKWAGKMALALVQIAFGMLAGTVLFGMQWGASLPMVCVVLLGWAAFNASLAIVLGNLARSEGQLIGIAVITSMVLAALGGCWWPIEISPPWMQDFALLLPTGWTMDAMHQLISFGRGAPAALPHTVVLYASALQLGWVGVRTFRYQ
jgi:hypothetical protein